MIIAMRESTTRKRAAAAAWTGATCMVSDGASGSYAIAADDTAPLVMLPGSVPGSFTFAAWVQDSALGSGTIFRTIAADNTRVEFSTLSSGGGTVTVSVRDSASTNTTASIAGVSGKFGASTWTLCAVTVTPGASDVVKVYCADATPGTATDATPGSYSAGEVLSLFATNTGGIPRLSGKIRSPAIWSRVLSDAEIAALYTAGPTHDLRTNVGAYTGGGPVHWTPQTGSRLRRERSLTMADPLMPRRHTVHEAQAARDVAIQWGPGQGSRPVAPVVVGRPETYPAEGDVYHDVEAFCGAGESEHDTEVA